MNHNKLFLDNSLSINQQLYPYNKSSEDKFTFVLNLKINLINHCDLIPIGNEKDDYDLCIYPTLKERNKFKKTKKNNYHNPKQTKITEYISESFQSINLLTLKIKYQYSNDLIHLLKLINSYFNRKKNNWGYFENNKYYNSNHITVINNDRILNYYEQKK